MMLRIGLFLSGIVIIVFLAGLIAFWPIYTAIVLALFGLAALFSVATECAGRIRRWHQRRRNAKLIQSEMEQWWGRGI